MKVSFRPKWMATLTAQQKDLLLGMAILLGLAIIYYFQWAMYLTDLPDSKVNIDQPGRYFWWANDSRSYRAAGEWIFGRMDSDAISYRPWLYPLLLGLARTLFGVRAETVLWISQFLMWLASGISIYLAIRNATRSTVPAIFGAGRRILRRRSLELSTASHFLSQDRLISHWRATSGTG